jgi:hypothetical protein
LENTEENCEMIWKIQKKGKTIVIRNEQYGRKASLIVKRFGKYRRKVS